MAMILLSASNRPAFRAGEPLARHYVAAPSIIPLAADID
jgi:hypothetical protein